MTLETLLQEIDETVGTNSRSYPTNVKVRRLNLALDDYWSLVTTTYDNSIPTDRSLTGLAEETFSLENEKYIYSLTDRPVRVVFVIWKDATGNAHLLHRRKLSQYLSIEVTNALVDNTDQFVHGDPYHYDVIGEKIYVDPVPGPGETNHTISVFYVDTLSQFDENDLSKQASVNPLHYNYLILYVAYLYARSKKLDTVQIIKRDLEQEKTRILKDLRTNGVRSRLIPRNICSE
jgi:hypothetical protein